MMTMIMMMTSGVVTDNRLRYHTIMLDDAASDNQLRYHRYQLTLSLVTGCVITSTRWRPRLSARSLAADLHEPAEGGADRAELVDQLGELGPLAQPMRPQLGVAEEPISLELSDNGYGFRLLSDTPSRCPRCSWRCGR